MDRSAPDLCISPTCDHPGCNEKPTGKVGFDWHCHAHRPGARQITLAIAADVPVVLYGAPFHEPVPGMDNVLLKPRKKRDAPQRRDPAYWRNRRVKRTERPYNPTIRNPLPLVLRENADAHPDLCRVAGCVVQLRGRGLCDAHGRRARATGAMDALGLPSNQGSGGHNRKK